MLRGYGVMGAAALLNVTLNATMSPSLPWSVLPIPLYTLGMSLAMPSLTLLALDPFPLQRGLASSCQMFLQSLSNAVVAGLIAPAVWGGTLSLALTMSALLLTGAVFAWGHGRATARLQLP